ncbi:MAG: hypothetical protein KF841_06410 [Phycisphaerae bacterium]|nr:hypothetical protein [Phycisphaerae bacterium]
MKNRPCLFEVINKAPQSQQAVPKLRVPFLRAKPKSSPPPQQLVAQALTEEEAAAELARRRALAEAEARARADADARALQEKQARRMAKMERKAAKEAERAAAREQKARLAAEQAAAKLAAKMAAGKDEGVDGGGTEPLRPIIAVGSGGRFGFSLNTATCMVIAGTVCGLVIVAFSVGRRLGSESNPGEMTTVAAIKNLEALTSDSPQNKPGKSSGAAKQSAVAPKAGRAAVKDLDELLTPPASVTKNNIVANQAVRIDPPATDDSPDQKKLNYVQIEWFQISADKSGEDLRAELEDVRRFLRARGFETFARELPRGFILYSAAGFRMSKDTRADREAFLRQIEKVGQEYFRGGGRYQFKDCFFVSHGNAMKGRPVVFKE